MSEKVDKILEKIKQVREAKGLTQGQVIVEMKSVKSNGGYSKLETGSNKITLEHLFEIAESLEVDISYFFQQENTNALVLNDPQAEIGYATKDDIFELKLLLKSIKAEVATIKNELQKPKVAKAKKKL